MFEEEIKNAMEAKKIIMGYKKSLKFIKNNRPKMVIIANNIPEKIRKEVENYTKVFNFEMKIFDGDSKKLGMMCGKPYPVTTIVITE
jgi:large subunit ribosomal protein L30e